MTVTFNQGCRANVQLHAQAPLYAEGYVASSSSSSPSPESNSQLVHTVYLLENYGILGFDEVNGGAWRLVR